MLIGFKSTPRVQTDGGILIVTSDFLAAMKLVAGRPNRKPPRGRQCGPLEILLLAEVDRPRTIEAGWKGGSAHYDLEVPRDLALLADPMLALGNGFGGQRMSSMTSGAHSAKTSYNQSVWSSGGARAAATRGA